MPYQIFKPFVLLMLLLMTGSSLLAQKDKGFNFPPDFGKGESAVLIREGSREKITEAMIEAFEKEYTGKFEAESNVLNEKRKIGGFQYLFFVFEEVEPAMTIGRERYPATTNYRFGLVDMQTGKVYKAEFLSGSYKKGAKYYVKNLEKFAKENGK